MLRSKSITGISADALETLLEEVYTEGAAPYRKLLERLRRTRRGSEAYNDLIAADLFVAAEVIRVKAAEAMKAIDEWMEALPDDDQ